jgi:hypothetical protein
MKPYIIILFFALITNIVRGQIIPEWEVTALNTGKAFTDIQTLADGSILSQLVYCSSRNHLPSAFYDSQKNAIPFNNSYSYDHQLENHKTLIKFNNGGIYQWSNSYNNTNHYSYTDNEFDFIGYKIFNDTQIIVLAKYNEAYFQKQDEELAFQREMQHYDDEVEYYEEETFDEKNNIDEELNRSMFGLQFLDSQTGKQNRVIFLSDLKAHNVSITNIERLNNQVLILAGRTYSQNMKITDSVLVDDSKEFYGNFISAINIETGQVLWYDVISYTPWEGFYFHESSKNAHLAISSDGTIYYSSQHFGDVVFSNKKHIMSDSIVKNTYQERTYLISYSSKGEINWIKNNKSKSYPHIMACSNKGIYIVQPSYGNQSFEKRTDTTNSKHIALSYINKKGKELWVKNFPVSKINSIQLDQNNLPIIQGVYYTRKTYQIDNKISLNEKHDFFFIRMTKNGSISSIYTEKLRVQDHRFDVEPTFKIIDNKYAYLSYHTRKYFTEEEREKKGIKVSSQSAFGDLCKLVKINLNTLKFD